MICSLDCHLDLSLCTCVTMTSESEGTDNSHQYIEYYERQTWNIEHGTWNGNSTYKFKCNTLLMKHHVNFHGEHFFIISFLLPLLRNVYLFDNMLELSLIFGIPKKKKWILITSFIFWYISTFVFIMYHIHGFFDSSFSLWIVKCFIVRNVNVYGICMRCEVRSRSNYSCDHILIKWNFNLPGE